MKEDGGSENDRLIEEKKSREGSNRQKLMMNKLAIFFWSLDVRNVWLKAKATIKFNLNIPKRQQQKNEPNKMVTEVGIQGGKPRSVVRPNLKFRFYPIFG